MMATWPLLALVVGCAFATISAGRWQVSLAAWLAPAFLLAFSRSQDMPVALAGIYIALFVAAAVSNRGIMPLRGGAYVATIAVQTVIGLLPFALDRLLVAELPGFAATLFFPAAWTATEFAGARLNPFGTWGSVAYTQYGNLPFMQLASVTGLWGITFTMTWFGSIASWAVLRGLESPEVFAGVTVYAVVFGVLMLGGSLRLLLRRTVGPGIRVAAIEPTGHRVDAGELMAILASAQSPGGDHGAGRRTLETLHGLLLATSEREILAGAAIVVWPEAGAPVFAEDEAALLERAGALARDHGIHLLLGIATLHAGPPFRLENRSVLIDPSGEPAFSYRKARPVPGWEAQVSLRGDGRLPVLASRSGRLATAICFDLDFPALLRQAGRGRADLLLAPASDWPQIGNTHHAMASFRAVENGMSMVRAARWGVSAIVDPLGRILAITDHRSPGADAAVAFVQVKGMRTVYARVGDTFAWLCVTLTGGAVSWGALIAAGIV